MKIWIKQEILNYVYSHGRKQLPNETGGILMGYRVMEDFVITDIIGPGENAVHEPTAFNPDQKFHETEVARIYTNSDRTITYLGDWHTHPNSHPYLSDTDKKAIVKISLFKKARTLNPIMLVAAPPNEEFKIWIYRKDNDYFSGHIQIY